MKLVKLFGIQDVLLLGFGMFVFKYGFLDRQIGVQAELNDWQYALMVLACMLIAAGGIFINNAAGVGKEANPDISEAKAYNIYMAINLIGIGLGYYIANYTGRPMFTGIFIAGAATLYIYATSLKQTIVVSNIVIALTMALPIVAIGIFNLFPILSDDNRPLLATLFSLMLDYAIFIFVISLILTFINDLANNDVDYNAGITTLPIVLGRQRTVKFIFFFSLLPVGLLLYYAEAYITNLVFALGYGLLCIMAPLVYFLIKLWTAKTQKDFTHLETVLKIVLFFTVLSIAVITFNIEHNVTG